MHPKHRRQRCRYARRHFHYLVERTPDVEARPQQQEQVLGTRSWVETGHGHSPARIGEWDTLDGYGVAHPKITVYTNPRKKRKCEGVTVPVRRSVGIEFVWNSCSIVICFDGIQHLRD